jgi:uncharacterized protein (DUF2249 family)/quercetin dioxygenase-like cupin family protein
MASPEVATAVPELDVRSLRKPDKHPAIFAAYDALPAGAHLVLVNDHDPKHLRDEFERDQPASFAWEYLTTEPRNWRIKITKLTAAPLPRILFDTSTDGPGPDEPDVTGAVWKLQTRQRDLDSNVIALPPDGTIDAHTGPDLDVLIHIVGGSGQLAGETEVLDLRPGLVVWLPRRSRRQFTAGPDGLRYLTVHQRRQALVLDTARLRGDPGASESQRPPRRFPNP